MVDESQGDQGDGLMIASCSCTADYIPLIVLLTTTLSGNLPSRMDRYYSLLGRGIHFDLLTHIEELYVSEPFLEPELRQISQDLLGDILDTPFGYWEQQEVIVKELESICQYSWTILREADQVLLHRRLNDFSEADAAGIPLGLRLGQYLE